MDTRNGTISQFSKEEFDALFEEDRKALVFINDEDATKRQKREMRVSMHDHRSKLGQQLTKERSERAA